MIYLILPCGSNFGWGICGKYLVKELCDLSEATLITENFDAGDIGDELDYHFLKSKLDIGKRKPDKRKQMQHVDHPVLQAITDQTLQPWLVDIERVVQCRIYFLRNECLAAAIHQKGLDTF